jgi:hypothetical protein
MEKFYVELSYTVPEDDARAILREYDKASTVPEPGIWAANAGTTVAVAANAGITVAVQIEETWRISLPPTLSTR